MSLHQIIYTSCMRGIKGVNDGQQVFSHDSTFGDISDDEIKSLFAYQVPSLPGGVSMTEELARTMPQSFIYRRLDNGQCALALNTYLGRDYMGSAGRFGNFMSHVIKLDEADFTAYPCEFVNGETLRDHMEFAEVNNPDPPAFLPTPELKKGYAIDPETVTEFLSEGSRMEVFQNMLYAMLAFETERKRVVICDEPNNIPLWIAALHYALPLRNALNVSFSTYDYDPTLSASQICGVVPEGTRFTNETAQQHFTFDLLTGSCPEFEKDADFFDFIDTAFSFSFDSLQEFHRYLTEHFSYTAADEQLYAAYHLYALFSDGIAHTEPSEMSAGFAFASQFGDKTELKSLLRQLIIDDSTLMSCSSAQLHCLAKLAADNRDLLDEEQLRVLRTVFADTVLDEFCAAQSEADFAAAYDAICADGEQLGLRIPTEMMSAESRDKMFSVLQQSADSWKIRYLIRVVSDDAKQRGLPVDALSPDGEVGGVYYSIVKAVSGQSGKNPAEITVPVLEAHAENGVSLTNMALSLEGMLLDLPDGQSAAAAMWESYRRILTGRCPQELKNALPVLKEYCRGDQACLLSAMLIHSAATPEECLAGFETFRRICMQDNDSQMLGYGEKLLAVLYGNLERFPAERNYQVKSTLFGEIVANKWNAEFADKLAEELLRPVPLQKPSEEHRKLIRTAFNYFYNVKKRPLTGRLLLLTVGLVIDGIHSREQFNAKIVQLQQLTASGPADMRDIGQSDAETYFDWLVPVLFQRCRRQEELTAIYELYRMPSELQAMFFTKCAELYLKQSRSEGSYALFCEFLSVVFAHPLLQTNESIGKLLSKLGKQKLAELNEAVNMNFYPNKEALHCWNEIFDVAGSTNPLLEGLAGLFRRKKD